MSRLHVFLDTSIFLHILRVPGYDDKIQEDEISACLKKLFEEGARLYLPLATILETGNHICRIKDGRQRKKAAETFIEYVEEAINGNAPWGVAFKKEEQTVLLEVLNDYLKHVQQGISLSDCFIIHDSRKMNNLVKDKNEKTWIWTLDAALKARSPTDHKCP